VCGGLYTVFSMSMLDCHSPLAVATYPTLFGGPVVLLLASPYFTVVDWGNVGFGPWAAVGYSAVFATAFAFTGWQRGISGVGPTGCWSTSTSSPSPASSRASCSWERVSE
jgi:drug/metabolite transporter (DMT)-like permease